MMSVTRTLRLCGAGSGTGTAGNIVAWGLSTVPKLDPGGWGRCAAGMRSTERSNRGDYRGHRAAGRTRGLALGSTERSP